MVEVLLSWSKEDIRLKDSVAMASWKGRNHHDVSTLC